MNGQIFISYRREESRWSARSLYDRLSARFDRKQIFMDVDGVAPGDDFVAVIEGRVGECDVLIAVIGTHWLTSTDERDGRRLDNPEDFVRMEIATALKRGNRVIPVLVEGATMPKAAELPYELKALVRRNALRVSDTSFDEDCRRLVTAIERVIEENEAERRERVERWRLEAERRACEETGRLEAEQLENKPAPVPQPDTPPQLRMKKRLRVFQLLRDSVNRVAELMLNTPKPSVHERLEPERVAPSDLADLLASGEYREEPQDRGVVGSAVARATR